MKNENMVRKIHNVKRTVIFNSSYEAYRFVTLYRHLFYQNKDKNSWNHKGYKIVTIIPNNWVLVHFTIKKSDFDDIVKNLKLNKKSTTEFVYS